jgi:hypothetical protein
MLSSSNACCACWQERLALQHKTEGMNESMAAQEHVALARSLIDLYNNRQSDSTWLDASVAAFAAGCEVVDTASGTTFHGLHCYYDMTILLEYFSLAPATAEAT